MTSKATVNYNEYAIFAVMTSSISWTCWLISECSYIDLRGHTFAGGISIMLGDVALWTWLTSMGCLIYHRIYKHSHYIYKCTVKVYNVHKNTQLKQDNLEHQQTSINYTEYLMTYWWEFHYYKTDNCHIYLFTYLFTFWTKGTVASKCVWYIVCDNR